MAEIDVFERSLASAFLRLADDVPGAVDAAAVAHRVALEHPRRGAAGRLRLVAVPRLAWVLLLLGALLAVMVGGLLVIGSQPHPKLPAVVPPVGPASTYIAVSARGDHTCALKANGTLECWGSNSYGQATPPDGTFVAVSASERGHTCAIRTDGTLACWGDDSYGQATAPDGTYLAVSAGFQHTCAIRTDGSLECWGSNGDGQSTPPSGSFSAVNAGSWHTCGIRTDGTLTCWGADDGRLDTPAGAYVFVDAGSQCAIRTDGRLACWGYDVESPAPPGTYLAVGGSMSGGCAIRTDGTVTCWGGEPMALGGATPAPSGSPVETVFPPEPGPPPPTGTFTALSYGASGWEACAIRTDGTLACWGDWIAKTDMGGNWMGPPTNLMPEMRGVLPASEVPDNHRGTVEFGSGGSGCTVTTPSTTFSVGDAIRFAANLEREVRADEVVTVALSVDGVLLERALLGEAASRSFDVPGDCVGGLLHWAYVAPPGIALSAFPIAWTTGHYRLELSAGGEVLAAGEFDVGP